MYKSKSSNYWYSFTMLKKKQRKLAGVQHESCLLSIHSIMSDPFLSKSAYKKAAQLTSLLKKKYTHTHKKSKIQKAKTQLAFYEGIREKPNKYEHSS